MIVPEDPTCINFSDRQEEAERQIKQLCTRLLQGWADLQLADMQVNAERSKPHVHPARCAVLAPNLLKAQ